MSNQYRNEHLHPSIIGRLNPYDGDLNTESWRFSQYVEGLENKYLTRGLVLDAKVRFLLALVPDQLLASAKTALITEEHGYLLDNLYQSMTWTEELDTNLFYAPACREYFLYPDEVQGPGVVYPTLDYKFYKSFILKFVAGDNGEDSCLTALNTIRQNNKDLRAHVGEFRILLNRYIELADRTASSLLSIFTNKFYESLDRTLFNAMTSYPNNLEEAITLATEASKNIRKRKSLVDHLYYLTTS